MAKVSAHGHEVGTIYLLKAAKRYMSDGAVLKNLGFGWKIHGKVKPGVTPQEAFAAVQKKQEEHLAARPAYAAYRKELHAMTGMCNRWKLHCAVELMPDDADGVWSEACDGYGDNCCADVDEVGNLCRLYKIALSESDDIKSEATKVPA
jgi:hypothetical protein